MPLAQPSGSIKEEGSQGGGNLSAYPKGTLPPKRHGEIFSESMGRTIDPFTY